MGFRSGALNGLVQTILKLTVPGVADFYQGTEFWDQSLVDPDNRRPIDFAARTDASVQATPLAELLAGWRDGRVKQAVIARLLRLRRRCPDLFVRGRYQKLTLEGPRAAHLIAFMRELDGLQLVTIVLHLPYRLLGDGDALMMPPDTWRETVVCLPGSRSEMVLHDVLRRYDPLVT